MCLWSKALWGEKPTQNRASNFSNYVWIFLYATFLFNFNYLPP